MSINIFEYAAEHKLRFAFKGNITVEDLYSLSVNDLDTIYKNLNKEVKQTEEDSLLTIKTEENVELAVKIEIIKHIVNKKLLQKQMREQALAKKAQKDKILSILAEKEDAALHNKSEEELRKMLEEL